MSPWLTRDPIDTAAIVSGVAAESCGATTVFVGTVRRSAGDGGVVGIEYSAYEPMAEVELGRIVEDALGQWPGVRVALRHRLGYVPVGEASIVIAVAAPHRAAAFQVCRFLIEETKHRAPVWKKERLESGEERWVEPPGV